MWSGALRHGENESGCDLSTQESPRKTLYEPPKYGPALTHRNMQTFIQMVSRVLYICSLSLFLLLIYTYTLVKHRHRCHVSATNTVQLMFVLRQQAGRCFTVSCPTVHKALNCLVSTLQPFPDACPHLLSDTFQRTPITQIAT